MGRRFQFSIRLMLVATAIVATAVGAAIAKSDLVAIATLDLMAAFLCAVAVMGATMTTGRLRAFWIGASIPAAAGVAFVVVAYRVYRTEMLFDSSIPVDPGPYLQTSAAELRAGLPRIWCFAPLNGLLCVFVHWLIWPCPPDALP